MEERERKDFKLLFNLRNRVLFGFTFFLSIVGSCFDRMTTLLKLHFKEYRWVYMVIFYAKRQNFTHEIQAAINHSLYD